MFTAIVQITLKPNTESDFVKSFAEANTELSQCTGFISRRLLKSNNVETSQNDDSFHIIVDHESQQTFEQMHQSPIHAKWHAKMTSYMAHPPQPKFYKVIVAK